MAKQVVKSQKVAVAPAPANVSKVDKELMNRMQKDFNARFNDMELKDIKEVHKKKCPDGNHNGNKKELVLDILSTMYSNASMTVFKRYMSVAPAEHVEPAPEKVIVEKPKEKKQMPKKKVEEAPVEAPKKQGKKTKLPDVIELPEPAKVAPKKPKVEKKEEKLDHKFVKVNKDGTTTPISEEEGQKALSAVLSKNKDKTPEKVKVVLPCPCYGCPKNELQKKCKIDCIQDECTLPRCKHQDYCATRLKELKLAPPKKTAAPAAPAVPGKKALPTKKVSQEDLEEAAAAKQGIEAHIKYLKAHPGQKNNDKLFKLERDQKNAAKAAKKAPAKKVVAPQKPAKNPVKEVNKVAKKAGVKKAKK